MSSQAVSPELYRQRGQSMLARLDDDVSDSSRPEKVRTIHGQTELVRSLLR
jgi:hypothetical protein